MTIPWTVGERVGARMCACDRVWGRPVRSAPAIGGRGPGPGSRVGPGPGPGPGARGSLGGWGGVRGGRLAGLVVGDGGGALDRRLLGGGTDGQGRGPSPRGRSAGGPSSWGSTPWGRSAGGPSPRGRSAWGPSPRGRSPWGPSSR